MTIDEQRNKIQYEFSAALLRQLLAKSIITEEEKDEIDRLNRISWNQVLIDGSGNL